MAAPPAATGAACALRRPARLIPPHRMVHSAGFRRPRPPVTETPLHRPLRTRRLLLRPLTVADAPALFPVFSDPDSMRWFGELHRTQADTEALFHDYTVGPYAAGARQWAILPAGGGAPVGSLSLHRMQQGMCQTGYILVPAARGRGLASEALAAVLTHAFLELGLHRVEAKVDPDNIASLRTVERLGFVREARLRRSFPARDEWRDEVVFGLLAREWLDRAPEVAGRIRAAGASP